MRWVIKQLAGEAESVERLKRLIKHPMCKVRQLDVL